MGEFLDQPARLSSSLRERKGNAGITPDNYQILPPSSNHIYTHTATAREQREDQEKRLVSSRRTVKSRATHRADLRVELWADLRAARRAHYSRTSFGREGSKRDRDPQKFSADSYTTGNMQQSALSDLL